MKNSSLENPKGLRRARSGNTVWTAGIMAASTATAYGFDIIGFSESTVVLAFMLGVLLVAGKTEGYRFGVAASVIGVLSFNYFFTAPRYSFTVHDPQYLVTFTVMLAVALMTSALTARVKQQAELSAAREVQTARLYRLGQEMLKVRGLEEIRKLLTEQLMSLVGYSSRIYMSADLHRLLRSPQGEEAAKSVDAAAVESVWQTGRPLCRGQAASEGDCYLPIIGQSSVLGVVQIHLPSGPAPDSQQLALLEAVSALTAMAVERERLIEAEQQAKTEAETERLRSTLLRSISHDLRTPLTGIAGAAGTLLENYGQLDEPTNRRLLEGINEDVQWLIRLVENLLSMTRLEAGKPGVRLRPEAVEEVVAEAVEQIRKRAPGRQIQVRLPKDLILLPMDGNLIELVLINLLDNAMKYTPPGGEISIRVEELQDAVRFEVADRGQGIAEADLHKLFDPFFTGSLQHGEGRKGSGLGLSICQAIIRAHHGEITAGNRPGGGASIQFTIPLIAPEEATHE